MGHVSPLPMSGANWRSLSLLWGLGPPFPKMAPSFTGSAHTPFPGYKTVLKWNRDSPVSVVSLQCSLYVKDSTSKCFTTVYKKWINLFHPCTHIQCLAGRSRDILLPAGRTQKRNLANLKTVSESWYPQESGTFQICKIPVLSAPNLHAKCCHFFWPGTVRICVGRRGGAWGLYCPLVTQNTQKHLKIQVYAFTSWKKII
jgi:hypothetical protein